MSISVTITVNNGHNEQIKVVEVVPGSVDADDETLMQAGETKSFNVHEHRSLIIHQATDDH